MGFKVLMQLDNIPDLPAYGARPCLSRRKTEKLERVFEEKSNLRLRNSQTLVRVFLERRIEEIWNAGLSFTGMGGCGGEGNFCVGKR
jgi:hypothetical protein